MISKTTQNQCINRELSVYTQSNSLGELEMVNTQSRQEYIIPVSDQVSHVSVQLNPLYINNQKCKRPLLYKRKCQGSMIDEVKLTDQEIVDTYLQTGDNLYYKYFAQYVCEKIIKEKDNKEESTKSFSFKVKEFFKNVKLYLLNFKF